MISAALDETFKFKFQLELDQTSKSPWMKFEALMSLLREYKIAYKLEAVKPKLFMVHKGNRGGLGLSPYNAHRNAATIFSVGANKKKLDAAFAMELAPSGTQRESNIRFNEILVARSHGLLAKLTGEERFATLGCGHTAAWCKTAAAGGITPESIFQDASGGIDTHKLSSDKVLTSMIADGWDWEIIPYIIDVMFPMFAHVAQSALNASNHVASLVSELETAVTLATTLGCTGMQQNAQDAKDWERLALENVKAVCAPCAAYAGVIMEFVKKFAGGEGAPR